MKGKFTDYVRPIVTVILTLGLLYGFWKQHISGDQYGLIYMSVVSYLFGESRNRKNNKGGQDEQN